MTAKSVQLADAGQRKSPATARAATGQRSTWRFGKMRTYTKRPARRNRHPSWMMHDGTQVLGQGWGQDHPPTFIQIRPYVLWILRDGREVFTDRRYKPIAW